MTHRTRPIFEIRAAPSGTLTGYASVWGGIDSYGDTIQPGAFAASIASGQLPAMLWAHDQARPIGRWTKMAEDSRGLLVEGQINLNTRDGADAFEHLRSGDVSGLSIGYRLPPGGAVMDGDVRIISQIDLHEISVVALPADAQARVVQVKQRPATLRDFEHTLQGLGFSRREAAAIATRGFNPAQAAEQELDLIVRRMNEIKF